MRLLSLIVLAAFLAACSRQVPRQSIEVRHYAVDWASADVPVLKMGGLTVQGLVLTPAQWPLEGSMKRLLHGDFLGVIDAFDLSFHSSHMPEGVLRRLYDAGYLAAYVRVRNPGAEARPLLPDRLVVELADGALFSVPPEDLPAGFRETDWARTGVVVLSVALLLAVMAAGREGRLDASATGDLARIPVHVVVETSSQERSAAPAREVAPPPQDPGLLRTGMLAGGQSREGFVLFRVEGLAPEWSSAQLAVW